MWKEGQERLKKKNEKKINDERNERKRKRKERQKNLILVFTEMLLFKKNRITPTTKPYP
jgi:predicted ribosome-associated RNA-binding protein Tma20